MKHDKMALLGGALSGLRLPADVAEPSIGALSVIDRKLVVGAGDSWKIVEDFSPSLYAFTGNLFTSAGRTGRVGPTLAQCTTAYAGQAFLTQTQYFNVISGTQFWMAPADGTYHFDIAGASAAGPNNSSSGNATFDLDLELGEVVRLVVGQMGAIVGRGVGGSGACVVSTDKKGVVAVVGGPGANARNNTLNSPAISTTTPSGPLGQTAPQVKAGGNGYTNSQTTASGAGSGLDGNGGVGNLASIISGTTPSAAVRLYFPSNTAIVPTGGYASGTNVSSVAAGGFGGGGFACGVSSAYSSGGGGGYTGGNSAIDAAYCGSSFFSADARGLVYSNLTHTSATKRDGSIRITRK